MSVRVFVVEDDVDIAALVARQLRRTGEFEVEAFLTGEEFLRGCEQHLPELVILDLNLPDTDGMTLCRELRGWDSTRAVPILMLTARAGEADRVAGLEQGADDYLTKPFSPRELLARVRALVRRQRWERGVPGGVWDDGHLVVDVDRRHVSWDEMQVHLTQRELDILWYLISLGGRVASREQILDAVWGLAAAVDARTVDAHIRTLRRKLGGQVIETVIGSGYRFGRQR